MVTTKCSFRITKTCQLINSQIREKLISEDGYHLSDDGVRFLAFNLRNQVESVLGIQGRNANAQSVGPANYTSDEKGRPRGR